MEFIITLHIETNKNIQTDDIPNDLVSILEQNGDYQPIGTMGPTEIVHNGSKDAKNIRSACQQHAKFIKTTW